MSWNLRALSALALACLTGGCSSVGGDAASVYAAVKSMWNSSGKVTLADAAAVPFASIGVRADGNPEILLILASEEGGERLWTSASRIAITTRDGRIVRTAGLEHNLGGFQQLHAAAEAGGARTVRWLADFPDLGLYSVQIVCRELPARDETIVILGKDMRTRRTDETCAAEGGEIDWSFRNTFWRDPESGLAWRTLQHVHPRADAIETEILRPPA